MLEISNGPQGRVLIVDDDANVLRAYGRRLRADGYHVVEASSGEAVESLLREQPFDIVLTDLQLPRANGIEVLRAIRFHDPDLPVALMTGGGDLTTAAQAVEHKALRYLLKPISPGVLRRTIDEGIALRRQAQRTHAAMTLFSEASEREAERAQLQEQFDAALSQVYMAYQPIVHLRSRSVLAHEALVRCHDEKMATPDRLFTTAGTLHRTPELGRAIRRAVAHKMGTEPYAAATFVNVHADDLDDDDLFSPDSPLSEIADRVVLEITERAPLEGHDLESRLGALRALGYRFALDDLGVGYAALSWLMLLRPEYVKLDMSLVRNIDRDPTQRAIVASVITLGRELGVRVIAEGVERLAQATTLDALGCELLQGFFFARPSENFPSINWPQ